MIIMIGYAASAAADAVSRGLAASNLLQIDQCLWAKITENLLMRSLFRSRLKEFLMKQDFSKCYFNINQTIYKRYNYIGVNKPHSQI